MNVDLANLPDDLCAAAVDVAQRVRAAGGRALMVGGSVRDLLCGRHVKDVDIEVFGLAPDDLKRVLGEAYALDLVGLSFGVLKIQHLDIDISLPRRESKRGLGHKGFDIASDPFLPIPEAASRRDFTVNAIYYDPLAEELIDPHGGARDLADGVLRHVSEKFREDPLRVLRGMQFVARFNLDPAPETIAICRTVTPEGLPPERLFEEWAKLLTKGVQIGRGLAFLRETGWVKYYPELQHLIGCKQDPKWHPEGDVWNHTCCALNAFARHRTGERDDDLIVGLAVLCHDFGKPATTTHDPDGHIRSRGHDTAGVAPTLSFLRRLTNEERILREVPPLVEQHMQPFSLWRAKAGDAAVRRLSLKVGRIDRLLRVAHADDEGRPGALPGGTSGGEDLAWLAAAAERLRVAAAAPKPILMGRDLIAMGYKPSPQFGKWLDACFEAQLDGVFSDHAGALAYFSKIKKALMANLCAMVAVSGLLLGCGCSDGSGRADMGSVAEDDRGGIAALKAENEALRRENQMLRRELISKNGVLPDSVMPEKGSVSGGEIEFVGEETGYWLSSKTKVRHNKRCRNYRKVKGHPCGPKDGRPCKACGG